MVCKVFGIWNRFGRVPFRVLVLQAFSLVLIMGNVACDSEEKMTPIVGTDVSITKLKQKTSAPIIRITKFREFKNGTTIDKEKISQEISRELSDLIQMIVAKDLSGLIKYVDPKEGLWVDLKAHRSHAQVVAELKDPSSYINVFFLDTKALQERTDDLDKIAVRDILLITSSIDVQVFPEGSGEFELKITLTDAPDYSYYLNNPVLKKKNGRWYIARML